MPSKDETRPEPDYKGLMLARYWYLIGLVFVLLFLALMLS